MPTLIQRPGRDPLKQYKWAFLGLVLMAGGGGVVATLLRNQGGGSAQDHQLAASEQSLDTLETAALSPGDQAPGNPISPDGSNGAYAKQTKDLSDPANMLYQPAGGVQAPGAPIQPQDAAALKNGKNGNSLAQALSQVASGNGQDKKGWGGEVARTGFSIPRANFAAFGGMGSGGGSSTSSSSRPSYFGSNAGSGSGSSSPAVVGPNGTMAGATPRVRQGTNQSLNYLRDAGAIATQAITATKADQIAGLAGKSFDATTNKSSLAMIGAGGSGVAGISDDAVPGNLKADDPTTQNNSQAPKVPNPSQVKTKQELQEEQQEAIQKMLISAAIGGVAGPIFGGVGSLAASSVGLPAAAPKTPAVTPGQ